MILKKSKIKIPYIRLDFRIVRQSDARWCERPKIPHQEEFSPTRFVRDCYGRGGKLVQQTRVTCKGKNHLFKLFKKWGVIE